MRCKWCNHPIRAGTNVVDVQADDGEPITGVYHSWCFVQMMASKGTADYSTFKAKVSKVPGDEGR